MKPSSAISRERWTFCSTNKTVIPRELISLMTSKIWLTSMRRQAQRRLVQKKELRPQHQPSADGEHLLFAAAQGVGHLGLPLPQNRKQVENLAEGFLPLRLRLRQDRTDPEILHHGHHREELAAFGDVGHAQLGNVVGSQARGHVALDLNLPGTGHQKVGNGLQEGRFTGAIGTDNGDEFLFRHIKGDIPQGLGIPIKHIETLNA